MTLGRRLAVVMVPTVVLALVALPARSQAAGKDEDALKAMKEAKLTLGKAIEAAETASKGTAVAAQPKSATELTVYALVGEKLMAVPVTIKTGAAGKAVDANTAEVKASKPADVVKALTEGKQTLAKIVAEAEKESKGEAITVQPKVEGTKFEFSVTTYVSGKAHTVVIDAKTGKVASEKKAEKPTVKPAEKPAEKTPGDKKPSEKKPGNKKP